MVIQQETTTTTQWEMTHEQLALDPSFDPSITDPAFDPDDPATWPIEWQPPITIMPIDAPVLLGPTPIVPVVEKNYYTWTVPVIDKDVEIPSSGSLPLDLTAGFGGAVLVALVIHVGKKLIDMLFEKIKGA